MYQNNHKVSLEITNESLSSFIYPYEWACFSLKSFWKKYCNRSQKRVKTFEFSFQEILFMHFLCFAHAIIWDTLSRLWRLQDDVTVNTFLIISHELSTMMIRPYVFIFHPITFRNLWTILISVLGAYFILF